MERYCSSSFWDASITWHTNDPDLTDCFEKTVLLWSACAFLWISASVDFYLLADPKRGSSSMGHDLPSWRPAWTWLTLLKLLNITLLIGLEVAVFCVHWYDHSDDDDVNIFAVPDVLWTTPIILIGTHFLSACLIVLHKYRCVHTSGIQLIHWSALSLVHCIIFRTEYKLYQDPSPSLIPVISQTALALLGVALSIMLLQSFVFCWADIPSGEDGHAPLIQCSDGIEREECPMKRCSCLSYVLYSWCTPLVRKGFKRPLTSEDLWTLLNSLSSPVVFKHFEKYYGQPRFGETRSICRNIVKPLWNTCGWSFVVALSCKITATLLAFVPPKVMGLLITFVGDKEIETWKGYMWAFILFLLYVVISLFWEMFYLQMFKCYLNVYTCLNLIIYRKAMSVSSEARKKTATGEVVNLMSVDVEAIRGLLYEADSIYSAPIQIIVGIIMLWFELGYSVLSGLAVLLTLLPINWYIAAKSSSYQRAQMKKKDQRIKLTSEVISGIQVIKLYAWEPSFLQQITKVRQEEVEILRKRAFCQCFIQFTLDSVPFLVSAAAFFTFVYVNNDVLDAKKAFTAVALFALLTDPITEFPSSISALVDASVSFKRVNNFLNAEENDPEATKFYPKEDDKDLPVVDIDDGEFAWEALPTAQWKLTNINLQVFPASFTAVVGPVGSGKSSLLSAILGDLKHAGEVRVRGKVAYVPQIAWILNGTLRENICFGLPYDREKYAEVLECCCLNADIEMLPAGDMTEIGEKGINLSGVKLQPSQKQRVSLARAAYSDADVLLLDDVISAVDAHVGKFIFDRLLGPSGLLKDKTRILCTHAYHFLSQVDNIVLLDQGQITDQGSYEELLVSSPSFASLLSAHSQSQQDNNGKRSKCTGSGDAVSIVDNKSQKEESQGKEKGKLIEDEHLETGDVKLSIFLDYVKSMGYPLVFTFVLFFAFSEGLSLSRNFVLSKWTSENDYVNGTKSPRSYHHHHRTTTIYAVEYGLLGFCQCLFYLFGYLTLAIATLRATQLLHNNMLQRIIHAPMSFFHVTLLGRITNRFSSDVESVDKRLPINIGDWICHIYKFVGILVAILYATNPYFLAYLVPLSILYYLLQRHYIVCMQQLQRIINVLRSPIYAQFQETLNGTSTIRAYKAQDRFSELLGDKIDSYNRAQFPHQIVRRWLSIRLGILGASVVFLPALFAVIGRNTVNPSLVGFSISYAVQITNILSWLIKVTSYMQYNFVSVERILEYTEVEQEADFYLGKKDPPPNWPERGEIQFSNYETRYRPGLDLVLKHFSCRIFSEEKIGIVGRTGAGKSSLTLALFRIVEAVQGKIQIDHVNIADLGLHQLRKRLTVIPQDPVLFSRSLRLNLDPFGEYRDDRIWEALRMAHLSKFVEELDNGLEYEVAEGGENLSVGQRQLVCLARAILRKSSVLVLDEATASVDSATDNLIQKTIRHHFADCTVLNVAHRLNTVMNSTRIMVLSRGEIVEFDTPHNLLANKASHFYGMAKDAGLVEVSDFHHLD